MKQRNLTNQQTERNMKVHITQDWTHTSWQPCETILQQPALALGQWRVLLVDERHGTEQEEEFGSAGHPAGQEGQTLTQAFQPRLCGELRCPKTLSINTQHVSCHPKNHWKLHRALETQWILWKMWKTKGKWGNAEWLMRMSPILYSCPNIGFLFWKSHSM